MKADRFDSESAQDFEQKHLCILVLDISSSIKGEELEELNNGLRSFFNQIQNCEGVPEYCNKQLEVAIIQYGEKLHILRNPWLIGDNDVPPTLKQQSGATETVLAIEEAIKLAEDREAFYRYIGQRFFRSRIVLITDGKPHGNKTSQADIDEISSKVAIDIRMRKYKMLGLGIGTNANTELIKKITKGRALKIEELRLILGWLVEQYWED